MARRPQNRSLIAENDQTMPTLSRRRIEIELDVPSASQAAKLTQQLVAVHHPCIASAGPIVKGDPRLSPTPDG
jgi:hypothetical protein